MATPWRAIGGRCRALLTAAKSSAASSATASTAAKTAKRSPAGGAKDKGILKPMPVSPELGNFLGSPEASRTDAVKKIWEHIKAHDLQNPSNKREIICDDKLKTLFGKDKVGFLEIARLLSRHFVKSG